MNPSLPRRLLLACALTCAASALPVAPAVAKRASLKGQVVGTPYVADTRSAIPVLLSKQSAKRAGLKSPVGVVILPRTRLIPTPDGKSRPGNLRLGDRFRAIGTVTGEARRAVYPRINLKPSSAEVYRRGKTLSNAELESLVRKLQSEVADVRAKLNNLVQWTLGELHGIRGDIAALRAEIGSLRAQLAALQTLLDQLNSEVDALGKSVGDQITNITSTLTTLTSQLTQALTELADVQNLIGTLTDTLGGLDPAQLAAALSAITALQSGLDGALEDIGILSGILDGADGILGSADDPITALLAQVAGLDAADEQLQGQIDALGVDVSALESTVGDASSGLVQQVNGLQSTMDVICAPPSLIESLC